MRFGDYATLANDDIWPAEIARGLRERLPYSRKPLARSLGAAGFEALANRRVHAVENAEPLEGPFPLVVIGQGLYYESPIAFAALAEYLAGRGFVVATAPLVGANSPIVRVIAKDLEAQIRDLEFVIARARELPVVSRERLGVFGFDMGGMAGVVLAMRNTDVDAFASADAGILYPHPAGIPQASPDYDPHALRIPWLHATHPERAGPTPGSGGENLFDLAIHADRYLLLSGVMAHVDFTSYALVENRSAVTGYWAAGTADGTAAHRAFAEYVYHFFAAILKRDAESLALLPKNPGESVPAAKMTLEHRAATAAPIGYNELAQLVIVGRAAEAVAQLRASADADPNHAPLDEESFGRLAFSLLFTWGLAAETNPLLELIVERYPASANALVMLGEAHILVEDYPAAIDVYDRLLEQDPDSAWGKSRLEWLRSR
jgi:hypothetical protein